MLAATERAELMINVLHLINGEFFSGVEQVVTTLIRHHQRVDPKLVCLIEGAMAKRVTEGIFPDVLPMQNRLDHRIIYCLVRYVEKHRIHLIHAHTLRANLMGSITGRITGLPVVVTIHSPAARETTHRLKNLMNSQLERFLIPLTTQYIAVCDSLGKEMVKRGVPTSRLAVIRNGIDVQNYIQGDGTGLRLLLGLKEQQPLIGTIALLRPRKGIDVLLKAIPIVAKVIPQARFVVIGDPENSKYGEYLRALSQNLKITGHVDFVSFRQDISDVLASLDIFVLPSLFGEGLPLVILEAMAAAKPVVGTSIEGIREAMVHGVTGFLVPPHDRQALARSLINLLLDHDQKHRMGQAAQQRVRSHFDATAMTSRTEKLYHDVLLRCNSAAVS
jgi:glycosyltransferase involved in cell wall biosynthesis